MSCTIEIEQAWILRDTQEQVFPLNVSIPYTIEENGFLVMDCLLRDAALEYFIQKREEL